MDNKSYNIRVPKRSARIAMIVGVAALIVAPLAAVATDAFSDVPTSHTHHNDITWLKDAAVTKGCNPPDNTNYCPDDDVTRAQMATFMRNLTKYIGAEDGTPAQADNADTLEGMTAADLQSDALLAHETGTVTLPGGDTTEVIALQLPPGSYLITGSAILNNNAGATQTAGCTLDAGSATASTSQFPLAANLTAGEREAWTLHLAATFNATTEASISCSTNAGWSGNVVESQIVAISVQSASATVLGQQSADNEDG